MVHFYCLRNHFCLTVQIDNMIVCSEEESIYRASFLDIPGPKQALMIGLAKTMCIEEDPFAIFKRLGIKEVPQLQEGQEYEFVLAKPIISACLGPGMSRNDAPYGN